MRVLWLVVIFAVAGCATPQNNYVPEAEAFSRPALGELVTRSVGDEMLSQGNIVTRDGIVVETRTTVGLYTLWGGFYPQTGQDDAYTYHGFLMGQGGEGRLTANAFADPPASVQASVDGAQLCVITVFSLHTCREREFSREARSIATDNSFQQTLLYSGRVGDRIRIAYRESSGNRARPAFSNDVEYDLSDSMVIGYRGAQIEIVNADNTSITYRVISNFNTR
ncbi:hypothetical protein [Maricaulis sp.]|uniref:hypothetical protein n=1 Tax=Maricaulis sp. TaxID=1486257 RepID=UPI003A8F2717